MRWGVPFILPRNQIDREVMIGVSCSPGWGIAALVTGILGLLFAAIRVVLPPPLTSAHREWLDYLLDKGHSFRPASDLVDFTDRHDEASAGVE